MEEDKASMGWTQCLNVFTEHNNGVEKLYTQKLWRDDKHLIQH